MKSAFIAVGSNLGNRRKYLDQARTLLRKSPGIQFVKSSQVYETEPVGGPRFQGKYLNAVWEIQTRLSPKELLQRLFQIERALGRVRTQRNAPRTLDLDILFYDHAVIQEPGLTVPHPRLHERKFALKPLLDLCPNLMHPVLKRTVREMYEKNR